MTANSIPEWFNLNKYENLKFMNRNQWRIIWLKRLIAYEGLINNEENSIYTINENFMSELLLDIEVNNIRDDLLCDEDTVHELSETDIFFMYQIAKINGNKEFIKVLDDVGKYVEESKEKGKNIEDILDEISIFDYLELGLDNSEMMKEIDNNFSLTISIDPHFSDEVILRQFNNLLSSYRERTQSNGKLISNNEIKSLIEYKVIPYIDLMLWGMATGCKIRDQEVADALFPDEYNISRIDTVRQTVKKKALALLSRSSPKFI